MTLSVFDAARAEPAQLAVRDATREVSFAELAERVARRLAELHLAGALDPAGQRPVAVVTRPTLAVIETLLALFAAGTPALVMHPRSTASEQAALCARTGAVREPSVVSTECGPAQSGVGSVPQLPGFDPERIAALVPTSGTTGEPRLVQLSHRAFVAAARASAENLGILDDRWLLALPLAHVGGLSVLVRSIVNRRALVLFEPERSLLAELERFTAFAEAHAVTLVSLVPTQLERLLAAPPAWRPPASLRAVLLGGAASPRSLVKKAREAGIPVLPTYGMTETCAQLTTARYATRLAKVGAGSALYPAGVPLPGAEIRIVNGLVEVRGPSLFSGYFGEQARLASDWHRTLDRACFDANGELTVTGRASDLIITGGENVDPLEVEAALVSIRGVQNAYVFGLPDPSFGERVAALLVVESPALDALGVRALLRAELASYKVPRVIAFVSELPLTPAGKLDRRAARSLQHLAR